MNDSETLREQMWDLAYGLLEAEESQALIARIKSDPQAARLYSEVRLQADLVGYAAQVEDASLVLEAEGADQAAAERPGTTAAAAMQPKPAARTKPTPLRSASRSSTWLAGIAAAALALLIAVGLCWPRIDDHQIARSFVVTDVETVRALPAGLSNRVDFHFTGLDGIGRAAEADLAVVDIDGNELYRGAVASNSIGQATAELPGAALQPGVRLRVSAAEPEIAKGIRESSVGQIVESPAIPLEAELPVQPQPTFAYLLFDRPTIAAGDSIRFSLWNLSAVTGQPVATPISGVAVQDAEGVVVAEPQWQADSDLPVLVGQVDVPAESRADELALAIHPLGGAGFSIPLNQNLAYDFKRQAGQAQANLNDLALDAARLSPLPQRRDRLDAEEKLAEQAEKNAAPLPAAPPPADARRQQAGDAVKFGSAPLAEKETLPTYETPADREPESGLPAGGPATTEYSSTAGESRDLAEQTLSVPVPAQLADRRALGVVRFRGAVVAQETVEPGWQEANKREDAGESRAPTVALFGLPMEADGPVDVNWFDATSDPPQLVEQQVIARPGRRKLNVQLTEEQPSYRPGEKVQLTLKVTDETGQPAPDTLLVARLWSREAIAASGREPLVLASLFDPLAETTNSSAGANVLARQESGNAQRDKVFSKQLATDSSQSDLQNFRFHESGEAEVKRQEQLQPEVDAGRTLGALGMTPGESAMLPINDDFVRADNGTVDLASLEPQILATNRPTVEAGFQAAMLRAEEQRRASIRTIGRVLLIGGCAGLLLLGLMVLFRLPSKLRVILPALAVAVASLLIGVTWIGWMPAGRWQELAQTVPPAERQVALAPAQPAQKAPDSPRDAKARMKQSGSSGSGSMSISEGAPAPPAAVTINSPEALAGDASPVDASAAEAVMPRAAAIQTEGVDERPELRAAQPARAGSGQGGGLGGQAERFAKDLPDLQSSPSEPPTGESESLRRPAVPPQPSAGGAAAPPAPASSPAPAAADEPPSPSAPTPLARPADPAEKKAMSTKLAARPDTAHDSEHAAAGGARGMSRMQKSDSFHLRDEAAGASGSAGAPASLYFNPHLTTDARGLATIEFTMPAVESDYQLLIDAVGQGRIGSSQMPIVGRRE